MRFHILDVFAERKYAGNQLAVVESYGQLTTDQMEAIAREFNFSETTFIESENNERGEYSVRIFTPGGEVPFAGHPTLGTAWLIRKEIAREPLDRIQLSLKAGAIPVTFDANDEGEMRQLPPQFGPVYDPSVIAPLLNLSREDLIPNAPIQSVSTGLPFIIVPVRTIEAIKKSHVHLDSYHQATARSEAKMFLLFTPEAEEAGNHIHARMFDHYYGVLEDPATGSACGCLAGYLVEHILLGTDTVTARVEQGYEIARPSIIRIRAHRDGQKIVVHVGGRVFKIAEGQLTVTP